MPSRKLAHSLRFAVPRMTAPAERSFETRKASLVTGSTPSTSAREPADEGRPATSMLPLDQHRHAVQRTHRAGCGEAPVELGRIAGGIGIEAEHGPQSRPPAVQCIDALEIRTGDGAGGERAVRQAAGQLDRRQRHQVGFRFRCRAGGEQRQQQAGSQDPQRSTHGDPGSRYTRTPTSRVAPRAAGLMISSSRRSMGGTNR